MTTIANLGIKVSSDGIDKTDIALGKLAASSARSEAAIDKMIESIKKQNMILNSGKAAFTDYAMTALGASEAEKKLATDIIKTTESIKASRASAAKQVKDNLAETKRAGAEQLKAINDIEKAETKRISSINKVIESLSKEEKALKMSKSEQAQYNLALLGASDAEKKAAQNIIDRISAIKSAKKAEDDATRAINESKLAKDKLIDAEKKRRDSVNTTIMKLRDEVAVLGKSDAQLLRYKLTLAGATEAEKKQALALQKTVKEYRESSDAAKKHDGTLMSLAKRVSALALIYGTIRTIKQFGDSLIETALIADNYKYSLQAVSTSNEVAAESYKYLKSESERLGLSITGQADSFVSFAASAKAAKMTVDETRASYTGLSEAIAAMHRSPEQAAAALNALQQMLGKGTVQSEELVRQLSNSLPGAVPLFADAMGVSVAALKGLMKDGLLPADIAVKAFTNFLSNQFQTAAETASTGIQGSLNRMQNATYAFREELVKSLGDEGLNLITGFTAEIKSMTKTLASPEGQLALKEMAGGIKAIGQAAFWTMQKVTSLANAFGESARVSREGIDLIKAGTIDQDAFFKASYDEKKKLIKEAGTVEDEHVLKFKINAEETLRITDEQLVKDKALIQASLKKKEADSAVTRERESNAKSLATMQENEIKRAAQIGKTDAEKSRMDAISLGATKEQAQAMYDLVKASDAKESAITAGIAAEKKAISEREAMEKKAESERAAAMEHIQKLEADRQGRIDAVIEKLREEIATYKQGEEVSAEYALAQDHASTTEMALAESLGKTIDNLKEKTAAQKQYNTVMDKVSPDKVELNREKGIQAVNRAMEAGVVISGGYEAGLKRVNDYFDKIEETAADKRLNDIGKELDELTEFDGSSFGNSIADGINNAVISMNELLKVYDNNIKVQEKLKDLQGELATGKGSPDERAETLKDIGKYEELMVKNQIGGMRQLAGTTSQLFKENSKERTALHNIEMAFAAIELAMAMKKTASMIAGYFAQSSAAVAAATVQNAANASTAVTGAVASVAAQGTVPIAGFAMVPAMIALMAGVLGIAGISFGGGGSSSGIVAPVKAKTQSGTVLGDPEASSDSLQKIEDMFESMHVDEYTELQGIHDEMKNLNSNITGLVSSLYRGGDGGFTAKDMGINLEFEEGWAQKEIEGIFSSVMGSGGLVGKITNTLGGFAGKIFGGGSESSVTAQGISVSSAVKIGDLIGGSIIDTIKFADIKTETDGGWFHSDKTEYSRRIEDLGTEVDNLFTQVFSSLGKSFVSVAEILGKDVQTVQDYVFKIGDIDLKNLETADEINEALNAAISTISDEAATELFGKLIGQYQTVGEGMVETAVRVASEKVMVLDTLDKIGSAFESADIPALAIAFSQGLLDVAGGLENFMEITSTYYDKFFTDEEKQADISEMLTESLKGFDLELPGTREFYRDLVEGIDLTTVSGQKAYVTLLELSGTADEYYSYLEDVEEKLLSERVKAEEEALAIVKAASDERISRLQEERSLEKSLAEQKYNLELELIAATEGELAATAIRRKKILEEMDSSLIDLQKSVWAAQDAPEVEAIALTDYQEMAAKQKEMIDGWLTANTAIYNQIEYFSGRFDVAVKNIEEGTGDFAYNMLEAGDMISMAAGLAIDALSHVSQAIEEIDLGGLFKSLFESSGSTDIFSSLNKFTTDITARIDSLKTLEMPIQQGLGMANQGIDAMYQDIQSFTQAFESRTDATADEIQQYTNTLGYMNTQLADLVSGFLGASDLYQTTVVDKRVSIESTMAQFSDAVIKSLGNDILPVVQANLSADIWGSLSASGAIDKIAAATSTTSAGDESGFQSTYAQLIQLMTAGTITTAEFNESFAMALGIFDGTIAIADEITDAVDLSNQRRELEIRIMELEGDTLGAIAARRDMEREALDISLRPLQDRIWFLEDEIAATEKAADLLNTKLSLENQLYTLQKDDVNLRAVVLQQRAIELQALDATLKPLQEMIWALEDQAGITEKAADILNQKLSLEEQLYTLTGDEVALNSVITQQRIIELAQMDATLRPLQESIWLRGEENEATEKAAEVLSQKLSLEEQLFTLLGDEISLKDVVSQQRAIELLSIDESNRAIQERIWALEDEAAAAETLSTAKADYLSKLESELDILKGNLDTAKSEYISKLEEEEAILDGNMNDAKAEYLGLLNDEATATDGVVDSLKSAIESVKDYRDTLFGLTYSIPDRKDVLSSRQSSLATSVMGGNTGDVSDLIDVSGQYLEVAQQTSKTSLDYKREVAKTNSLLFEVQGKLENQLTEAEIQAQAFKDLIAEVEGVDIDILTLSMAEAAYNEAKAKFDNNQFTTELAQFEEIKSFEEVKAAYYVAKDALDNNWYEMEIAALKTIDQSVLSLRGAFMAVGGTSTYAPSVDTGGSSMPGGGSTTATTYGTAQDVANAINTSGAGFKVYPDPGDSVADMIALAKANNIPGFANGGYNTGGLSLIGEKGMELSYRPPSQIMSNSDMMTELSNKEVVKKLNELIAEVNKGNYTIAKNTQESAKTLKKFDIDGMPEART